MIFTPIDTTPYIGLRAFAEDDSIYFKGREEHILQITALLEQNKFLMVTGASGDGKSSLVYAGLVPNARAGFFRAKFPNWVVADFRPERSPLKNLSKSISKNLRIGNEDSVEIELRRGFSSLVDLYQTSSLWVDDEGESWTQANLLIIADQFEEFFTNPENYYRNHPSADSQLVINLLLETARIAIEKGLPIYIVCTMRSDYIGQCASFRGLPEFVGFSQFFVPRLKRKEMIEVVREPASLHGDKISNRLVERVVYDLGEGIDQLPVLQHAMHEVWTQANQGNEELDLLHYAMAGGMAAKDLPVSDREKFETWFRSLPQSLQDAYHQPGLSRIIDTHANKLFLSAAQRYNETHQNKINDKDAQLIIKAAFISLTKMDEGRAVRNRMTLQEITNIIDRPDLDYKVVGGILNIFREPGNTFLRPYISDDPESKELNPNSVLDITHESLIRNWELLLSWANEEYENFTIYEDFKKQLDRWIDSGKSDGFLLSIGPLTYFESWYEKLKPNAYWVNRYLDPGTSYEQRISSANSTIEQSREFLKKSARKHVVTRLMVRYGSAKMAGIAAAILVVAAIIYLFIDNSRKQNPAVIRQVVADATPLLSDRRVVAINKAVFLMSREAIEPNSYKKTLATMPPDLQINVCADVYTEFAWNAIKEKSYLRTAMLMYIDSMLNDTKSFTDPAARLKLQDMQVVRLMHHLYFMKDERVEQALKRSLTELRTMVMDALVKNVEGPVPAMNVIDDSMEQLLNNNMLSEEDIKAILTSISPFESDAARGHFNVICPPTILVNYNRGFTFTHAGGYQELAYLYASLGDISRVKSCIDTLMHYSKNYHRFINNPTMMGSYFLKNHHEEELVELMQYYAKVRNMPVEEGYSQWLNTAGLFDLDFSNKIWVGENHNIVHALEGEATIRKLFDLQEREIRKTNAKDQDALHYKLAMFYKDNGSLLAKMTYEQRANATTAEINSIFDKSIEEYKKVSEGYINEVVPTVLFGRFVMPVARKDPYLYPDRGQNVRNYAFETPTYYSSAFLNYTIDSRHFTELYGTDVKRLRSWLERYWLENMTSSTLAVEKNYTPLTIRDLERIDSLFSLVPNEKLNGIANHERLMLIHEYLSKQQYDKIDAVYGRLDVDRLSLIMSSYHNSVGFKYNVNGLSPMINELAAYFISKGRVKDADNLVSQYINKSNRVIAYADIARRAKDFSPASRDVVFPYFDSAASVINSLNEFVFANADPRIIVAYSMSEPGDEKYFKKSEEIVKKVSLDYQTDVVQTWILGIAASGKYYKAYSNIPEIAILSDRLTLYNEILITEAVKVTTDPGLKTYLIVKKELMYQEDYGFDPKL